MQKRILVTGSNGLLGQKLTDYFLQNREKYVFCATGVGINRHPVTEGYLYHEMDVLNAIQMTQIIEDFRPDFIIHTAAMTHVDACEDQQVDCQRLNVGCVEDLIKICERQSIHLIHISTDFIFDGINGPYKEDDQANPLSFYGKSKLDSEQKLIQSSISWTILRTILVYGVVADMSRSNFVLWAKQNLQNNQPIQVVEDQWRMPTLAEDLAKACFLAIDLDAKGVFHISGVDGGSIYELVLQVARYWHLDESLISRINSSTLSQKAIRPAKTGFDLNKAMSELNYTPKSFQEGLQVIDQQLKIKQV